MARLLTQAMLAVIITGILLMTTIYVLQTDIDRNPVDVGPDAAAPLLTTGEFVAVTDRTGEGRGETVVNSRGRAVRLSGANDSYVQSDQSFSIASDDTWTVSTWVSVNTSAGGETMTALSANGRVLLQYNGSDGNWSVWYFDEGTRDSYRANVSAPNQPGNLTRVSAWHNGTHLAVYRNATRGDVVNTTPSNIASADLNATAFHGVIEETRTFDDALNDSQRSALLNRPVYPLANATRTARLMYDRDTTSVRIYFADAGATASNVTYVDGWPGETMTRGADYEWRDYGPYIKATADGRLAGAPVAFVDFGFSDPFSRIIMVRNFETLTGMMGVLFTTIAIVVIGSYLHLLRGR